MTSDDPTRASQYRRMHDADPARDVDTELGFHLEMHVAELVRRGRTPEEAHTEAMRRFGDMKRVRLECERLERERKHTFSRARMLDELKQDIRWALRSLRRTPAFTLVVVLTLGLGIGANSAIFSVVNAYLVRPLPVKDATRLVVVAQTSRGSSEAGSVSVPNFEDVRALHAVFDDAVAYHVDVVAARAAGWSNAERSYLELVSDNYFQMLGVRAAVGSLISPESAHRREPLIVLDYRYWQRRFQGDSSVVGRSIALNGSAYTIAGVAERRFTGTEELLAVDAYIAMSTAGLIAPGAEAQMVRRDWTASRVLARLRDGVSIGTARAALASLATRLEHAYPKELASGLGFVAAMETMARPDIAVSSMMPWVAAVFMVLVGLVLMIACVNVTNLMLARSSTRHAELAVRRALGASGARLVRQLVTESLVLSTLGLACGLLLAQWATSQLSGIQMSTDYPVHFDLSLDWRVLGFTALVATFAGLLTGLAPALQSARGSLSDVLREGTRGGTGGVARRRLRDSLVVVQVAVSLVLLISAGLFVQSVRATMRADLGFRPANLMLMSVDLKPLRLDSAQQGMLRARLLDGARTLAGVRSAALASGLPMGYDNSTATTFFDEDVPSVQNRSQELLHHRVSEDYFVTMGFRLEHGREFARLDTMGAPRVAIINHEMARRYWPGKDPLLQHFRMTREGPPVQVVGVVNDTKYMFVNESPRPFLYLPVSQSPANDLTLHLRTVGEPTAVTASARALVRSISPDLVVFDVRPMTTHLNDGLAFMFVRLGATIATVVGLLGLIQAIVGLYGVISYGVSQRTREIGIRLALGASRQHVMFGVMRSGLTLTSVGLALGLGLAALATRYMQGLLVGVSATDWRTFTVASVVLAAVAALSAWLPARRAAGLEPVTALRSE